MPAVSKSQQRLMGQVLAEQKGQDTGNPKAKELATKMDPEKVRHYAETSHEGLPEKQAAAKSRYAIKGLQIQQVPDKEVDYELDSPNKFFGTHANLVPMHGGVMGQRVFYGFRFQNQALPILNAEPPNVQALADNDPDGRSFDDLMGRHAGAAFADKDGTVSRIGKDYIELEHKDGTKSRKELYKDFIFNRLTSINNTPVVERGQKILKGQALAKSNFTDDKGTLALGLNASVGVVPYLGHSMDDAIVVSEAFAKRLTSDHMYGHGLDYKRGVKGGKGHYVGIFPKKYEVKQLEKLDKEGVIQPGQLVQPGDPLVLATRPKSISSTSVQLGRLSSHMRNARSDASVVWDQNYPGVVTDVVPTRSGVKVSVKTSVPTKMGDKIVFRSGQKGTISKIIPDDHMPRTASGGKLEVLLNPLGIPSRVNNSMIYELLLGKIAAKTGKPYKVKSFTDPGQKWYDFVENELKANDLSDVEEVFDPQMNRKLENPITVGNAYILKLQHMSSKKMSSRGQGAYSSDELPLKGGDEMAKSKRMGGLEASALVSSGGFGALKDISLLRGARNDEYWQQLRAGHDPKKPDTPFVWNKFNALLNGAGFMARKMPKGVLRLGPMTEKHLDDYRPVEIKNPELVDIRTLEPVPGGLFDNALTAHNKYGYIRLPFSVPNPAFEETVRNILGMTEKEFRGVMAGEQELPPELQKRLQKAAQKAKSASAGPLLTGPEAIEAALATYTLKDVQRDAEALLEKGTKTHRPKAIKLLRAVRGLGRNDIQPSDLMVRRVPVIPTKFRPFSVVGDAFSPGDANELYRDLLQIIGSHKQLNAELGPMGAASDRLNIYDATKAVYGMGDAVLPKTKARGVSGFLKKLVGTQAKYSFFQRKLTSKPVDFSGRGVIGVDPELSMDEIGIPTEMAYKIYSPYIQRRLVRSGMSPATAIENVNERMVEARRALEEEIEERPVIYSRAPAWHKFNVISGHPKLIDGDSIMISPLVTEGHNADFDGDTMNIHVPGLPEAVEDAQQRLLPSKMLFSIKEHGKVVPQPKHELLLGLYTAQHREAKNNHVFASQDEAVSAIKRGEVRLSDEVEIDPSYVPPVVEPVIEPVV